MRTFFLHAECRDDIDALHDILLQKAAKGCFSTYSIKYHEDKDFTQIDITGALVEIKGRDGSFIREFGDTFSYDDMIAAIAEVPDGHRMAQTLATDIDIEDYDWVKIWMNNPL